MQPILTDVAANEVLGPIVHLVAKNTVAAFGVERAAVIAESGASYRRCLWAPLPLGPVPTVVFLDRWKLRLATQTVDTVLAVPGTLVHFGALHALTVTGQVTHGAGHELLTV